MKLPASFVALCPFVITACAAPAAVDRPATPGVVDATSPPAPTTRYRIGDFIVYRYAGAFSPTPVVLREQVRAQEGNRLRIDVTATRGAEELRWMQGRAVSFEEVQCADFLWTHADGRFLDTASGEVAHGTEIVEVGRVPGAAAAPLVPLVP